MALGKWSACIVALLATSILSGCTTGGDADGSEVTVITDPNDFSYLNDTRPDQRAHLHDYWRGAQMLQVLDQTVDSNTECLTSSGCIAARFTPPEGSIVPLGTARVEMLIEWQDSPQAIYERPELWVQTAADRDYHSLGEVASGDRVVLDLNNTQNDIPHQRLSAWRFAFFVHAVEGQYLRTSGMEVSLNVQAHRGLEIPLFPGHPDLWGNETQLNLIEERDWFTDARFIGGGPDDSTTYGVGSPHFPFAPDDGALVPFNAKYVEVVMEYNWELLSGLELYYHGADTLNWTLASVESDDGSVRIHRIPVGAAGDSPYASQSVWGFWLRAEGGDPVTGDGVFRGRAVVTATVHREG